MTITVYYTASDGQTLHDTYENIPTPGVQVNAPGIVLIAARSGDQAQAMYPLSKIVKMVLDHGTGIVGASILPGNFGGGKIPS